MKSKLFLIFVLLTLIFFSASLNAQNRFVDNAGLLSPSQASEIREMLDNISEAYNFDLVIVTEIDIGNISAMNYADDFFDYNGYGFGEEYDGCLFLQVINSRDFFFSTSGRGIRMMNNSALTALEDAVIKHLREDDYYQAYRAYVNRMEVYLELDAQGKTYSSFHNNYGIMVVIAWIISILAGIFIVSGWKKSMNTALPKTEASPYIIPGTLAFSDSRDRFLYSRVAKTAIPKNTSSGGSGGSRIGSSGRSHGGRGGKY